MSVPLCLHLCAFCAGRERNLCLPSTSVAADEGPANGDAREASNGDSEKTSGPPEVTVEKSEEKQEEKKQVDAAKEPKSEGLKEAEEEDEEETKRQEEPVCQLCLGMFSERTLAAVTAEAKRIRREYSDVEDFKVAMAVPNVGLLRRALAHRELGKAGADSPKEAQDGKVFVQSLQDAARARYSEVLEPLIGAPFASSSLFTVHVYFGHAEADERDCAFLQKRVPHAFAKHKRDGKGRGRARLRFRQAQGINAMEGLLGRGCIDACVAALSRKDARDFPWPVAKSVQWKVVLTREQVVLGGRYVKLSRTVAHSRGFADAAPTSAPTITVEDCIGWPLKNLSSSDAFRFTSSGREDIDTRMLGEGRPFAVALLNPRRVAFDDRQLEEAQDSINASASPHGVTLVGPLRWVSKHQLDFLKAGETDKVKAYEAICFCREAVPDQETLDRVAAMAPVELDQATPVRVLNNRSTDRRRRSILSLALCQIPNPCGPGGEAFHWLKAEMDTQAGTYVKEFVHGDFGRTRPNLAELLSLPSLDCHWLDVTRVGLPWPPATPDQIMGSGAAPGDGSSSEGEAKRPKEEDEEMEDE